MEGHSVSATGGEMERQLSADLLIILSAGRDEQRPPWFCGGLPFPAGASPSGSEGFDSGSQARLSPTSAWTAVV